MKKLILTVSLLAPIHVVANNCAGFSGSSIQYEVWNRSEYTIGLTFGKTEYGENPDNVYLKPHSYPASAYECQHGFSSGYENRATLKVFGNQSNFDLAYVYIDLPFYGEGRFSYMAYSIKSPQCSCTVRSGRYGQYQDCSSFTGPVGPVVSRRIEVNIGCL